MWHVKSIHLCGAPINDRAAATMAWKWDGGVMCFSPTMEEFRDFSGFVHYMEEQGAHKYGVAKVSEFRIIVCG